MRCDCSSSLSSTRIILDRRRQVASEKMAEFEKKISEAELQVGFPCCTTAPRSPRTVKLSSCGGNCWFRRARMSCAKPISPRPSSCITQAPSEPRTPYVPTIPNIPITHKPPPRACKIARLFIIGSAAVVRGQRSLRGAGVGVRESTIAQLEKTMEKTIGLGQKLDIVFTKLRSPPTFRNLSPAPPRAATPRHASHARQECRRFGRSRRRGGL